MAKSNELTTTAVVILEDGTVKAPDELTDDEKRRWRENSTKRLSSAMSRYYSQHPDEFVNL